ncbi:hypothetical protein ACFLU6_07235 [Acidobacteriota bacterium]
MKKAIYVGVFCLIVAGVGITALRNQLPVGPIILVLSLVPLLGLPLSKRAIRGAVPDIIFGSIDTGLLTLPALLGAMTFGIPGAIAGGVIGDAITDSIAGFFEGSIAEWLRKKGIDESRERVTTALGKMTGCLLGSGLVLSLALLFGVRLTGV